MRELVFATAEWRAILQKHGALYLLIANMHICAINLPDKVTLVLGGAASVDLRSHVVCCSGR